MSDETVWVIATQGPSDKGYRLWEIAASDEREAVDRLMAIDRSRGIHFWSDTALLAVYQTPYRRPTGWCRGSNDEPWDTAGHLWRLGRQPHMIGEDR